MPHKVLIVDDEPHMLRVTELSLKKGGYHLVIGRNGLQAIELAGREKPDLIVMDVNMPELDGLAALQQLKASPDTAAIPVIMLTVRGHALTRQQAEESCHPFTVPLHATHRIDGGQCSTRPGPSPIPTSAAESTGCSRRLPPHGAVQQAPQLGAGAAGGRVGGGRVVLAAGGGGEAGD